VVDSGNAGRPRVVRPRGPLARVDRSLIPDDELAALARDGEEEAFVEILRRYRDRVATFLHGCLRDRDAALDLAQETFVRLHGSLGRYRPQGRFRTFLFTIAANAARDALKARRRSGIVYLSEYREILERGGRPRMAEPDTPAREVEREALRRVVRTALARLPGVYREALLLREAEDLPYEELARVAGCSVGTAKSRVSRARRAFGEAFRRLCRRSGLDEAGNA
jgi:RNA polymerase sigma-70 factor (ECF subfamily)